MDLSEDCAHCVLASTSIQYERLSHARERQIWGEDESHLQNFRYFLGFRSPNICFEFSVSLCKGRNFFCEVFHIYSIVRTEACETFHFFTFLWYLVLANSGSFLRIILDASTVYNRAQKGYFLPAKLTFGWIDFAIGVVEPLKSFVKALLMVVDCARETDAIIQIRICEHPSEAYVYLFQKALTSV